MTIKVLKNMYQAQIPIQITDSTNTNVTEDTPQINPNDTKDPQQPHVVMLAPLLCDDVVELERCLV